MRAHWGMMMKRVEIVFVKMKRILRGEHQSTILSIIAKERGHQDWLCILKANFLLSVWQIWLPLNGMECSRDSENLPEFPAGWIGWWSKVDCSSQSWISQELKNNSHFNAGGWVWLCLHLCTCELIFTLFLNKKYFLSCSKTPQHWCEGLRERLLASAISKFTYTLPQL